MSEKEIVWDLSEIFSSCDDPKIAKKMDALTEKADGIVSEYKGKINMPNFTAQNMLDLLEKQENILAGMEELEVFSGNSFSANMTLPETKALNSKFEEFHTKISKKLAFLDLEVGKLINENKQLITTPILKNYKHYLEKIRRESPHRLSEIEEQLILEKDEFGVKAWSHLKNSWLYSRKFKVMVEGEEKILSYGEADSLISVFGAHPDRETRISANKAIYGLLGGDENIYSSALRNLCGDWMRNTKRRRYDNPMHQSLITNDITQNIIDNLMKTVEENVDIYQRYLKIKTKILNLPKLSCADISAPVLLSKGYTWDETNSLIIQAFSNFNKKFEEYVMDMFKKNHIDASNRVGKFSNAYCSLWYNGKSAYISLPFTGTLGDVFILAHELGHGVHAYLSSREQKYFNFLPGHCAAETASIFGTLLVVDLLLNKVKSENERIAILTHMLDNLGGFIFYISTWVWFEQGLYDALEKGEYLDGETISKYWCAARDKIYGDSVEWFDEMIWEWIKWPHFYFPNDRFYNYPYVYAQLFGIALYQAYKKEGKAFVPKFKKLLSAGGSLSPEELGKIVGLDITKPDFWQLGMKQYEEFVDELEKLTK